jgi:hypothetical protein
MCLDERHKMFHQHSSAKLNPELRKTLFWWSMALHLPVRLAWKLALICTLTTTCACKLQITPAAVLPSNSPPFTFSAGLNPTHNRQPGTSHLSQPYCLRPAAAETPSNASSKPSQHRQAGAPAPNEGRESGAPDAKYAGWSRPTAAETLSTASSKPTEDRQSGAPDLKQPRCPGLTAAETPCSASSKPNQDRESGASDPKQPSRPQLIGRLTLSPPSSNPSPDREPGPPDLDHPIRPRPTTAKTLSRAPPKPTSDPQSDTPVLNQPTRPNHTTGETPKPTPTANGMPAVTNPAGQETKAAQRVGHDEGQPSGAQALPSLSGGGTPRVQVDPSPARARIVGRRVWACAGCGITEAALETGKLHQCSACKSVRYCGKACQGADWPAHKSTCKRLQAAR